MVANNNQTFNRQNEMITSGGQALSYDRNGNLAKDQQGNQLFYNAWNRLVSVQKADGTVLTSYQYDGLGRRIQENGTNIYFNTAGQVIEEKSSSSGQTQTQYVWSPAGGNLLVERDDTPNSAGTLTARYYVQQNAVGSVTAIVGTTTGAALERYVYSAFGQPTFLGGNWTPYNPALSGASSVSQGLYNWSYLFQGQRYYPATKDYGSETRDYNPVLGRWQENDPIGFGGGDVNTYRFVGNNPVDNTDRTGLTTFGLSTLIGTAIGGATGFVGAGLTGSDGWSWERAWAGAASGAMVGAGVGLMIDTWGASTPLSAGLVGAGLGAGIGSAVGGGLITSGGLDGNGWMQGGVTGAVTGFTGGYASGALAPMLGCRAAVNIAGGFAIGAGGDALGQVTAMALGLQSQFNVGQMFLSGGLGAGLQYLMRACFTAEHVLNTLKGKVRWDELKRGERVASGNEFDPYGPIEYKEVEEVFETYAVIWHVHVAGKVIRTTGEHPFYVWDKGWIAANQLEPGDRFRTKDGQTVIVEEAINAGYVEKVYNCRVADYHTYFVGGEDWGFSVWAHNAYKTTNGVKAGEAGEFGALDARRVTGDLLTPHHMPQAALGFTPYREGGALVLPQAQHVLTRTYGTPGAILAAEEAGVAFRTVLARDIRDVRSIASAAGSNYNQGMLELLAYYRANFPGLMAKVKT